ncbi:Sec8 exocyst complex component-specific domain-containing protein [Limtongia smithiae]|uniref:Sec8 exocyst complex component-specific domain-containing protein n=1 Tax=Limtongia smithiae TaxID=1125753 RepID=UPI0034CE360A
MASKRGQRDAAFNPYAAQSPDSDYRVLSGHDSGSAAPKNPYVVNDAAGGGGGNPYEPQKSSYSRSASASSNTHGASLSPYTTQESVKASFAQGYSSQPSNPYASPAANLSSSALKNNAYGPIPAAAGAYTPSSRSTSGVSTDSPYVRYKQPLQPPPQQQQQPMLAPVLPPSNDTSSYADTATPPIPLRKSRSRTLRPQPLPAPSDVPRIPKTLRNDDNGDGFNSSDSQQINDTLKFIQRDWGTLMDDDCNPVATALELMDTSSVGRASELDDFRELSSRLEKIMQTISNERYNDINNSISAFKEITVKIEDSETRVRVLRETLTKAKQSLTSKQAQMRGLDERAHRYREMINILERIEKLQNISEKLEQNIADKQYKAAFDLLQDGLSVGKDNDLDQIVAVQSLKQYLRSQERALFNVMGVDTK